MNLDTVDNCELVDVDQFFAPTPHDLVDSLIGQYAKRRAQVEQVAALFDGDMGSVVDYFMRGNVSDHAYSHVAAEAIFKLPGAIAALNADFWSRALNMTDVYNCMPQPRRDEWNNTIRERKTPEFTEENVRATLEELLLARGKFFAERVDGIFRALSHSHVTNTPEGFNRRMILEYVFSGYGTVEHSRSGTINDLRCVIAKFMGRDEPRWNVTGADLRRCRSEGTGEWHVLDGGALRVRVYKKGTAHLEVHPEIAWRLNAVLHSLYPHAIPSNQRTKPPKQFKTFAMMARPLPFAVLQIIEDSRLQVHGAGWITTWCYSSRDDRPALAEAKRVLAMIGGVEREDGTHFDYNPASAIREIIMSGCIPDRVSHQFYPTPENVAREAIELAQIGDAHRCLEPSAGVGGLADFMPKDRTTCVEISKLHCAVLESKGHAVKQADFLEWSKTAGVWFDRIVMNPPFSEGRAVEHVRAAFGLLKPGGRLVAILPASMRGKGVNGAQVSWSQVFANEFAGTSCAVAIATIERAP